AVELGHSQIHEHQIGEQGARALNGLSPRRRLADDLDAVGVREQPDDAGTHDGMIVSDENANHGVSLRSLDTEADVEAAPSGRVRLTSGIVTQRSVPDEERPGAASVTDS